MMMGFGFLVLLLLGGGLIAILLGDGWLASGEGGGVRWTVRPGQPPARQVLDERFARGEIGPGEYETIRAQLER